MIFAFVLLIVIIPVGLLGFFCCIYTFLLDDAVGNLVLLIFRVFWIFN